MTTTNDELPMLLTTDEAASLLRIAPSTLSELRKSAGLPFVQFGKRVMYKRDTLMAFIDKHQTTSN